MYIVVPEHLQGTCKYDHVLCCVRFGLCFNFPIQSIQSLRCMGILLLLLNLCDAWDMCLVSFWATPFGQRIGEATLILFGSLQVPHSDEISTLFLYIDVSAKVIKEPLPPPTWDWSSELYKSPFLRA